MADFYELLGVSRSASAEQIKRAVTKGLAGERTTTADVDGGCAATFTTAAGL